MDINLPSEIEYTLKMKIFAQDKAGQKYRLTLHTEQDPANDTNIFLDYSDRILVGDVVKEKVSNAIREDFGIDKIISMELLKEQEELEDEILELEEQLLDYELAVLVEYFNEAEKAIGQVYSSWIPLSEE